MAIAIEQIHIKPFCTLKVQTKFILQIKSIVQAIPCWQTHAKLTTLFRTERSLSIPCKAAHPRICHIREYPRPTPPEGVWTGGLIWFPIMPVRVCYIEHNWVINDNKYFIKNEKSVRPIGVKKIHWSKRDALYTFFFFFAIRLQGRTEQDSLNT